MMDVRQLQPRAATQMLCLLAAVITTLAVSETANASTLSMSIAGATTLTYTADPGETNVATVTLNGTSSVTITDPGATIVPITAGCTSDGNSATCTLTRSLTGISVDLDDLNDSLDASSLPSNVSTEVDGGFGDDTISTGSGGDEIGGGGCNGGETDSDSLSGGGGSDEIDGGDNGCTAAGSANDRMFGGADNDRLEGEIGDDLENGGSGDDDLSSGPGYESGAPDLTDNDDLIGGGGSDGVQYTGGNRQPGSVSVTLDNIANDGLPGIETDNVHSDVNTVYGSEFDDTIVGSSSSDRLAGLGGNDTISGGNGNDDISDGGGTDSIAGNDGDDIFDGTDGSSPDTFVGGPGIDKIIYLYRLAGVAVNLNGTPTSGQAGEGDSISADTENAIGGSGPDTMTGNAAPNDFDGSQGNDSISTGAGPDAANGNDGNDVLDLGTGTDRSTGGSGVDYVFSRDTSRDVIQCGADNDTVRVDSLDSPEADCESAVGLGAEPVSTTAKLDSKGRVSVTAKCQDVALNAKTYCTAKVYIRSGKKTIGRSRQANIYVGATKSFTIKLAKSYVKSAKRTGAKRCAVKVNTAYAAGKAVPASSTLLAIPAFPAFTASDSGELMVLR